MHKTVIKNGTLILPDSGKEKKEDILIENGRISAIEPVLTVSDAVSIDAENLLVLPGLIDSHVHLREPGYEYKETIETGLKAAAKGGITSVCSMPNTNPVCDNESVVRYILDRASNANLGKVYPIGAVTKNLEGKELSEIGGMKKAGAVALSDDGFPVINAYILRRAMEYASTFDLTIIDHCEDLSLSESGVMHEGYYSTVLGLGGIPSASEDIIVARDIFMAIQTGIPVHIAHVSSRNSVKLIRWAKSEGIPVTAEVTVQHLLLTDKDLVDFDTNFKIKPPFRTEEDRLALIEGLIDDTIDSIVTDHAPHADIDKDLEFNYAAFGIIGLETCLPLLLSSKEIRKKLSLPKLISKMTTAPAHIFNLPAGRIAINEPADIVLVDPEKEELISETYFASKSNNSPFIGWKVKGVPVLTYSDGKNIYSHKDYTLTGKK